MRGSKVGITALLALLGIAAAWIALASPFGSDAGVEVDGEAIEAEAAASPVEAAPPAELVEAAPSPAGSREIEEPGPSPDEESDRPQLVPVLLRVVDRATGRDLPEVTISVRPSPGARWPVLRRQEYAESLTLRADSPITVPPKLAGLAVVTFVVMADGHAAKQVALDFESGGEREVALDPACELRVFVDAPPGDEKLRVELRRLEDAERRIGRKAQAGAEYAKLVGRRSSAWTHSFRVAASTLRGRELGTTDDAVLGAAASLSDPAWMEDAPRGEWIVFDQLEPGDWLATLVGEKERAAPLGCATATLDAGESDEIELSIHERSHPDRVRVAGTIVLDPGWSVDDSTHAPHSLVLDKLDRIPGLPGHFVTSTITQFEPNGAGRFAWDAGMLVPGLYSARVKSHAFTGIFMVPDQGATDVELIVGAPCEVSLRIVDAQTGSPAPVPPIEYWSGDGDPGDDFARLQPTLDDDVFRFRAPLGPLHVRLQMFDDHFFTTERTFRLASAREELTFELEHCARVRFHLRDGSAAVPWIEDFLVDARRTDGKGGLAGWSQSGRDFQHVLSPSGRYAVTVDGVPGFERSVPVEFDAVPGQVVDVEIPLVRAR